MSFFDIAGILVALAAVLAYLNHKLLKLPTTVGLMLLALLNALAVLAIGRVYPPALHAAETMMGSIDFDQTLMQGMLGYLLFAGALHVNLNDLKKQTWVIALLATIGVCLTTAIVGGLTYFITGMLGIQLPLIYCLIFGSIVAPTDPIAVLSILKTLGTPKTLETKIAGESLFNDGVGVVVFLALLGIAGLGGHGGGHDAIESEYVSIFPTNHWWEEPTYFQIDRDNIPPEFEERAQQHLPIAQEKGFDFVLVKMTEDEREEHSPIVAAKSIATLFALEAGGGLAFGFVLGLVAFVLLYSIDHYATEILVSLAVVTGGYALAMKLHLSGPLAMVVAGLMIGNHGRTLAMSESTREHLDTFWELVDELLNAVLFVLIGLEVLVLSLKVEPLIAGALAIPAALLARFIAVGGVISVLRRFKEFTPHAVKVMTWGGLRGGISVALALSLKEGIHAEQAQFDNVGEAILTMTYVVVAFSILVGGLTMGPMLKRLGLSGQAPADHH